MITVTEWSGYARLTTASDLHKMFMLLVLLISKVHQANVNYN